ncbi:MAG: phage portal protein, partial [Aeromicrobium sp.]
MSIPTVDDLAQLNQLQLRHDAELAELRELNDEYELQARQLYMHPEIQREIGDRLKQVVIAWPMLVVDALDERLDVEGFRLPDSDAGDEDLWRVWQENDCDEGSQLGHIDALVMKRSYIAVGSNEDDEATPLVTFESPLELFADIDPRNRSVRSALRRWSQYDNSLARTSERYATLYLPNRTVYYGASSGSDWLVEDVDEHGLGVVPIVPMVNRGRLADHR